MSDPNQHNVWVSLRNSSLGSARQEYCERALSVRTRASYSSGVNVFIQFCELYGVKFHEADWVGSEATMVNFVCFCAKIKGLAHSTIKLYLAGVRNYCIISNLKYPFVTSDNQAMLQLQLVLKGVKRSRLPSTLLRLPITAPILGKLFDVLNGRMYSVYIDKLLKAAMSAAFFGLLRSGEITTMTNKFDPTINLCLGDILMGKNEAHLTLKASKTDPFRTGMTVSYFRLESTICAVKSLADFLEERLKFAVGVNMPLFLFDNYTHLTRKSFLDMLHEVCRRANINSQGFLGHSFRIGGPQAAQKLAYRTT